MHDRRPQSSATVLRLILGMLFWVVLWRAFGWGWGLSAGLVSLATGMYSIRAIVPIPGMLRGLLELVLAIAGVIGSFQIFGLGWGLLVLLAALFAFGINSRQLLGAVRRR